MFSRPQIERIRLFGWVLLIPVSFAWAIVSWARRKLHPKGYRSSLPVLCVGNIHSGGSGKTPLVDAIARKYRDSRPAILSRGYRGKLSGTGAKVDRTQPDGAVLFGDEAWMLSHLTESDIYIDRDRARGLRKIEMESSHRFVVMDDGFQHLRVVPSTSLLCVNSVQSPGNSFCLPLGDLREPWMAVKSASAVVLIDRGGVDVWREFFQRSFANLPVFSIKPESLGLWEGTRKYQVNSIDRFGGFCGLAEPAGFAADLVGIPQSVFLKSFPDHHAYGEVEIKALVEKAKADGVTVFVTSEKDWFKVYRFFDAMNEKLLSLRTAYEIPSDLGTFLDSKLRVA